jgi:hypothetical protein
MMQFLEISIIRFRKWWLWSKFIFWRWLLAKKEGTPCMYCEWFSNPFDCMMMVVSFWLGGVGTNCISSILVV